MIRRLLLRLALSLGFVELAARLVRAARPAPKPDTIDVPCAEVRRLIDDSAFLFDGLELSKLTSDMLDMLTRLVGLEQQLRGELFAAAERSIARDPAAWVGGAPSPEAVHGLPPDLGQRCTTCAVDWPPEPAYTSCPCCGEPTVLARGLEPLTRPQAWDRVAERDAGTLRPQQMREDG